MKNKQKIIHVIYSGLGGHANVLFPLLESNTLSNYEHIIVFFGVEKVLHDYIIKAQNLSINTYTIQKKPRQYIKPFYKFKSILKKEKPNHILVHSSELLLPALKYRKKNRSVKVNYIEHENNTTKGVSLKLLSKIALKKANTVVCLSNQYKQELQTNYKCKVPIQVIPNGINISKYLNSENEIPKPFTFGMASRMIQGKDHSTLLRAFSKVVKKYPETMLNIAGDGETLSSVKAKAKKLNLENNILFLGLLNENEMIIFYQNLSVYIQATLSETLCTSILQAMSCQLPVIASDIENNKPLINNNETGWLYLSKNSDDLARIMLNSIEYPQKNITISENARKFCKTNFSNKTMAKGYKQLIEQ